MKKLLLVFSLLLVGLLSSCGTKTQAWVDYTTQLTFNKDTTNKSFHTHGYGEVTLTRCVDGDTVHFKDKTSGKKIEARFLGVDTPESTGQIEEWGKKASKYTAEKIKNASKIVLSSVGDEPEQDSNGRDLAFVWVDGVNLNLSLVQEGLSPYKHIEGFAHNDIFMNADFQAQAYKLNIWSKKADPDFYYGEAVYITLKELRENQEQYIGAKITVEGVVTKKADKSAYLEDTIDGRQYGVYIYAGYTSAALTPIKKAKNRARVTGKVTVFNDVIQISDIKEEEMTLISEGNEINPTEVQIDQLVYSQDPLYVHTLVKITNVKCVGGYTEKENDGSNGSFTVEATVNGKQINLRFDAALKANYKKSRWN